MGRSYGLEGRDEGKWRKRRKVPQEKVGMKKGERIRKVERKTGKRRKVA